jgi:hypothetical protein
VYNLFVPSVLEHLFTQICRDSRHTSPNSNDDVVAESTSDINQRGHRASPAQLIPSNTNILTVNNILIALGLDA